MCDEVSMNNDLVTGVIMTAIRCCMLLISHKSLIKSLACAAHAFADLLFIKCPQEKEFREIPWFFIPASPSTPGHSLGHIPGNHY
jgi:hypothetical protein